MTAKYEHHRLKESMSKSSLPLQLTYWQLSTFSILKEYISSSLVISWLNLVFLIFLSACTCIFQRYFSYSYILFLFPICSKSSLEYTFYLDYALHCSQNHLYNVLYFQLTKHFNFSINTCFYSKLLKKLHE